MAEKLVTVLIKTYRRKFIHMAQIVELTECISVSTTAMCVVQQYVIVQRCSN